MAKSDTESEKTDVESPSTEDSKSTQNLFRKKWRLSEGGLGKQESLHITFVATLAGLVFLCIWIGIYSFMHMEELGGNRPIDAPNAIAENDDLAFDIRPGLNIDVPRTKAPSQSPANTVPPASLNLRPGDLLTELRSIFGQEIALKVQSQNSALSMAYNWILNQDQYVKTNPKAATVQRFMIAAFYFSTGGRRTTPVWDLCSAVPENTQESATNDAGLPIRCVFEGGQSVCAFPNEFLECPQYYQDWETPPAAPKKRWLSNSLECDWYGVSCNDNGQVSKISLPNNGLQGSLLPEIVALEKLTHIHLDYNNIGGPIPALDKMDIRELSLGGNNLSGRLVLSDQWPNLERLVLANGNNNINIDISPRFGLIPRLRHLDLSGNQIDSGLPDQAAYNWGILTNLRLSDCHLDGSLPQGLIGLSSLVSFEVDNNSLTGTLPSSLWRLTRLETLHLDMNQFHGTLSSDIGNLINLREFSIAKVGLTGVLPTELSKLQNLESVSLQHNIFASEVPQNMCSLMPKLHTLEADCGWAGFPCSCCTLCCEALVLDPEKCHSQ